MSKRILSSAVLMGLMVVLIQFASPMSAVAGDDENIEERVAFWVFALDGEPMTLNEDGDRLYFTLGRTSFNLIDAQYNCVKADEAYSLSVERAGDLQWTMYDSVNSVRYEIFKCGAGFTVYTIPDCGEE